jgi:hypothetical protein
MPYVNETSTLCAVEQYPSLAHQEEGNNDHTYHGKATKHYGCLKVDYHLNTSRKR